MNKQQIKDISKNVLMSFLCEDELIKLETIDEEDIDIISDALSQAIQKGNTENETQD